jgi:purine catabolism regulator
VPTVADILSLDVFKDAAAEVVSGERNLANEVRWVHVAEMIDIAHLLKGGELLLTTGIELDGLPPSRCARFVSDLRDAGVAGVVIEIGTRLDVLPDGLVRAAESQGLPLIVLNRETRFVEITEQVHARIVNQHYKLIERADEIARTFTELLLQGVSLGHIVHRLAEAVNKVVVLEDAAHQIVEYAPESPLTAPLVERWHEHSRQGHQSSSARGGIENTVGHCAWRSITIHDKLWGRLHMMAAGTDFDELDSLALDRTASTISLSLLTDPGVVYWSEHAKEALIFDILRGRYVPGADLLRRASAVGADLAGKHLAVAVIDPVGLADQMDERQMSEIERQQLRNLVLTCVRDAVAAVRGATVAALDGDRVIALIGLTNARPVHEQLDDLGSDAATRISERVEGVRVVVGLSQEVTADAVRRGLDEAREAVQHGRALPDVSHVHHYGDFGIESLLVRLADGPDLARFVEGELGRLLAHDASSPRLLPTLRAYLECRSVKGAAYTLGVERRSLYHRLARITELLGRDLDDADVRAQLWLALKALDILRARHQPISKPATSQLKSG